MSFFSMCYFPLSAAVRAAAFEGIVVLIGIGQGFAARRAVGDFRFIVECAGFYAGLWFCGDLGSPRVYVLIDVL